MNKEMNKEEIKGEEVKKEEKLTESESEEKEKLAEGESEEAIVGKETKEGVLAEIDTEEQLDVRKEVISWIRAFVITIAVALFLICVVFINAVVPTGSMENTIMPSDRLVGFRFSYWFSDPERGDIILFKYPVDESKTYIKRIIGLPGETVTIKDAKVYIDDSDTPLEEDYIKGKWTKGNDGFTFKVPEDSYFVMGDNRNNSEDSRFWSEDAITEGLADTEEEAVKYSFVKKNKIKGKAIWIYYKSPHLLH